jgi:Asp-tRNA(Asn)/Glu-tRNA(Gln) amidotransferase A subunit family amidase
MSHRLAASLALASALLAAHGAAQEERKPPPPPPSIDEIRAAFSVIGLSFTNAKLELLRSGVGDNLQSLQHLRDTPLENGDPLATVFNPLLPGIAAHIELPTGSAREPVKALRPANLEDLAFADLDTLGALIHSRKVSCVELAQMFLTRLHRLDASLHCVITFCDERALAQAAALDAELAAGHDHGPLHGIPWGAKDLLATKGVRTTWGAEPFETQMLPEDAEVVRRLDAAGAVLCAKLAVGALAWGDVWFGGVTRNPWRLDEGSSGSSAGSGSAVAAGALPFAIGTETLGSIMSPSARCGLSSLRPTFGRVSRRGAMTLCWTMDKLGPMTRSARDTSLVFAAIQGVDPLDDSTANAGLPYAPPPVVDVKGWRVGYLERDFGEKSPLKGSLDELRALGVELVPVKLPEAPLGEMLVILSAEAAEAFDRLTLDGQDDQLARQVEQAWPNVFRTSRLIPAVEYLRAQRLRRKLMVDMDKVMSGIDVLVHSTDDDEPLIIANLTGHPTACAPCGFREDGTPRSLSFTGHLYAEAGLLGFVEAWQATTKYHLEHPRL